MSIKDVWHEIKAISIIGKIYEKCVGSRKVAYIEKKCCEELAEDGEKYIKLIENTLKNSGMLYYAHAGTLLGLIRERKFIDWDLDIDYGIVISPDFSWSQLEKLMTGVGFKKSREFVYEGSVKEQSYAIKRLNVDFFGHFYEGNHMLEYLFEYIPNCTYNDEKERSVYLTTLPKVVKTKKVQIGNMLISVPANYEDVLTAMYNEDWRIPNPNWKFGSGKCTILLKNGVGYQIL